MTRLAPLVLVALAGCQDARPAPAAPPGPAAPPLRAGVAKVEITRPGAIPAGDPLYVKALVLKSGAATAVLVTLDAVAVGEIGYVPNDYLAKVRGRLQKEHGIPPESVVVNASHCHGTVCADVDAKTVEAVAAAAANLVPVRVGVGVGHEDRVSENRRLRLKDGREVDVRHAYSLPPDAEVVGAGPIDPEVGVLRLDRADGRTLAVVFTFACHPIMGTPAAGGNTADLSGFASRLVEEAFGGGAVALFVQGCGGDVNPLGYKVVHQPRDAEPLGNRLGLTVVRTARAIQPAADGRLAVRNETLKLPRADHSERIDKLEAEQARLVKSFRGTTLNLRTFLDLTAKYQLTPASPADYAYRYQAEKARGRDDLLKLDEATRRDLKAYLDNVLAMEDLTRVQTTLALLRKHQEANRLAGGRPLEAELVRVRVGGFVLVTFPGELTVEAGRPVKQASPHRPTFVAGYTNGYLYYTPTAAQLRNPGAAQEDCDTRVAPEWERVFHDRAAALLRRL
jgi:hypothetical protein